MMVSCMTEKQSRKRFPCPSLTFFKVRHDTVEKLKIIETIIPPDSGYIRALIHCDSSGKAYIQQITDLKNGRKTTPFIRIKENVITAGAVVDSLSVYTAFKERYITESSQETVQLPPVEIKFVPKVVQFFAWSGALLWGILLVIVGIKLFKIARKVWPI